jgi:predicted S18 family serine protease
LFQKHLNPRISKILNEVLQINKSNAKTIYDYIITEQNEINIKESTKETKIKRIAHLSKYFHHQQSFMA